jgi:hypothetical protein
MSENTLPMTEEQESLFSGLPSEVMEKLTPAKLRMIMLYLTGQYTQTKIGQIVGVSANTIRAWLLDENIQHVISTIQQKEFVKVNSDLGALKHKAVSTLYELLDSDMDTVRYQAAKDILDRGGHKAQQSIKVDKTVVTREEQLKSIIEATMSDTVVDVEEYSEVVDDE